MQNRPDKQVILGGVAALLKTQVLPAIEDRGLAFRVRIAAWLLGVVERELSHEQAHDAAELAGLVAPLGEGDIGQLNAALAEEIRAGELSEERRAAITEHLLASLRDRLAVAQPRFDTAMEPEG